MVGRTISHYKILEKLGEGGMGVVYKAEDLRLERPVALKFLNDRAGADRDLEARITGEARAAAALDHPNICPVYEIDRTDGQLFIAMAFVDGETVKTKLESGPLGLDEALEIATQVARGLRAAHDRGITHRDIKSANVIVAANRRARILDFGLALRGAAERKAAAATFAGTPEWMSPEQVRGEPLDHRTDIWSWGVLVYEMLAGRRPFRGSTAAKAVSSVLNDRPPSLAGLNPEVPPRLERIVERTLAKRPEDRYADMNELLAELQPLIEQATLELPFPLTLGGDKLPSVAVLPFADLSPGSDQEYFCDGIAEEIINDLAHLEGLHVVSRTSTFAFRGRAEDIRAIGQRLGASTVLEGSVRRAGSRIRVSCQLIGVEDGYHLWSEQYDRAVQDVFAIQEEIAHQVTRALEVELTEQEAQKLGKPATTNVEAYEYYLRGRQFFYRSKRQDIEYALEMFSQAISTDPGYARALAGIAYCHAYLVTYFGGDPGHRELAGQASLRALELDPRLAEAHAARGLALSHAQRHREAERAFKTAIRLDPSLFEAYYFYARSCFAQGKAEQAVLLYERAAEVDPADLQAISLAAFTYLGMGETDKAASTYRAGFERIERHLKLNPDDARAHYLGACALYEMGEREACWQWIDKALAIDAEDPYNVYGAACLYSRAGRIDEGIRYFERALRAGFTHREWIENDTDLDPIRGDPRFARLLDELGASDPGVPVG